MAEYIQWRNKNAYRAFPIADDASWVTSSGLDVSSGIFSDAVITPIDPDGSVHVSSINFEDGTVTISDDSGVIASATIQQEVIEFYDDYSRHIGIIVLDESFHDLAGNLTFPAHALPLAPTAVAPQVQEIVRGFILPDGDVVTGDVQFVGQDGITVTTESTDAQKVRFDALYEGDPDVSCVELDPPVKCIEVVQTGSGGVFAVALSGNILTIDTAYQLEDVCGVKRDRKMPREDGTLPLRSDPCADEEPEVPCAAPDVVGPLTHCGGELFISIVSSLIGTEVLSEPGIPAYGGFKGLESLPERPKQGLRLFMRGMI